MSKRALANPKTSMKLCKQFSRLDTTRKFWYNPETTYHLKNQKLKSDRLRLIRCWKRSEQFWSLNMRNLIDNILFLIKIWIDYKPQRTYNLFTVIYREVSTHNPYSHFWNFALRLSAHWFSWGGCCREVLLTLPSNRLEFMRPNKFRLNFSISWRCSLRSRDPWPGTRDPCLEWYVLCAMCT